MYRCRSARVESTDADSPLHTRNFERVFYTQTLQMHGKRWVGCTIATTSALEKQGSEYACMWSAQSIIQAM